LDNEQQTVGKEIFIGGVSLVNVWATWCPSCRIEHPFLNRLKQQGVTIFGVNYKDDTVAARTWLTKLGNPYRLNIIDKNGRLGIDLGVSGAPETYIVDRQGMIRFKHVGIIDERVWQEKLLPVIKKLES
jgi:cytochrome c biogenesis protein CcmG/thiol:disulfide interchange protein DsbE